MRSSFRPVGRLLWAVPAIIRALPILETLSVTRSNHPRTLVRWESELLIGPDTLELTLIAQCEAGQERAVLEAVARTASGNTRILLTSGELEAWLLARIGPGVFSCRRTNGPDS